MILLFILLNRQCIVLCTSLQHTRIEYRIQKSTANAARNIYECISCIHKLLCLHIMRRKKNIRFLSLHNILGMFSFEASKTPYSLFVEIYLI